MKLRCRWHDIHEQSLAVNTVNIISFACILFHENESHMGISTQNQGVSILPDDGSETNKNLLT